MMRQLFRIALVVAAVVCQPVAAKVRFAGVNIAGFDFGSDIFGHYSASSVTPPLPANGIDGPGQMRHFQSRWHLNVFRLPVMWQYLVKDVLGGPLDSQNFSVYNQLVQACLSAGAYCVIDIHNYARWNGQIISQSNGTVTNAHFASLWSQLASYYAHEPRIIFGLVNEPHDLDIDIWVKTVQQTVTAIRKVSPDDHIILLPGTVYTAVGAFIPTGSTKLANVTNPGGGTKNLIFDVHQYLDDPPSGLLTTCARTGVDELNDLGDWLKTNRRQAFLTETGGGSTPSCYTDLCAELDHLNHHTDVYLGWIGWAAGAFDQTYNLSLTPKYVNGSWVDTGILKSCVAGKFQ